MCNNAFFFFFFNLTASLCYKEAVVVCSQLEWMCTFSRPRFVRLCPTVVPSLSRAETTHVWITGPFLPVVILDCYSLGASHAVTVTNWFNHQLQWSLKLLEVPAKLMNCSWMWNEPPSPFPTISYQSLLCPSNVKGRRFRLEFNNGLSQKIEPPLPQHSQLQFSFHTLLCSICIQLIHWIIDIPQCQWSFWKIYPPNIWNLKHLVAPQ